jgi:hypothetical protein
MNQIGLKSIGELIRSTATPQGRSVEHYLIPDYQRGYRWKAHEHVKALLDDIDAFINKKRDSEEIYCLQPIVVVAKEDAWEVIDGQQRLTTLFLILKALGKEKIYDISYTHRPDSSQVLNHPEIYREDMPDHYFICEAYKYILEWFNQKESKEVEYKETFSFVLMRNIKVIWYQVDLNNDNEREKIDIFNRLNIGKIPLDDAELIRALFIQHITTGSERQEAIDQSIFSNEWNEIELFLQNDEVWGFLQNGEDYKYANRILKLFEIVAQNENSQGRATFLWFEKEVKTKKAKELWEKVKTYFGKIRYWFADHELYHLIGLLVQKDNSLQEICNYSNQVTKSSFREWLQNQVKEKFNPDTIDDLEYGKDNSKIERLLLLFNVLSAIETKDNQKIRFPFYRYSSQSWSLEHINAQHSDDPMKDPNNIIRWINETTTELENIKRIEDLDEIADDIKELEDLKIFLDQRKGTLKDNRTHIDKFNRIKEKIEDFFSMEEEEMHSIENLALLSSADNSSLNNAIFPIKCKRLFQLEKEGSFIPECTKNVFLKNYSKSYTPPYRWSKEDREDYMNEINRVFNNYFNKENHE